MKKKLLLTTVIAVTTGCSAQNYVIANTQDVPKVEIKIEPCRPYI